MRPITRPRIITQHLNKYLRRHCMSITAFAENFLPAYTAGYIVGIAEYKPRKAKAKLIEHIVEDCSSTEYRGYWQDLFRSDY